MGGTGNAAMAAGSGDKSGRGLSVQARTQYDLDEKLTGRRSAGLRGSSVCARGDGDRDNGEGHGGAVLRKSCQTGGGVRHGSGQRLAAFAAILVWGGRGLGIAA